MHETRVVNRDVSLAVRDFGGDGPAVLAIPGMGRTLLDFEPIAPFLTQRHRLVSLDLRCHGQSDAGPFTKQAVLDDLSVVVDALDLGAPALLGHSLGGMLSAAYAADGRPCDAVVNLDGHNSPDPRFYNGMPADLVAERTATLTELSKAQLTAGPSTIPPELMADVRASLAPYAEGMGLDLDFIVTTFERAAVMNDDGSWSQRPGVAANLEILDLLAGLDLYDAYATTPVPTLVVLATGNAGGPAPENPALPWLGEFMGAMLDGREPAFKQLAERNPRFRHTTFDASHYMMVSHPKEISGLFGDFLAEGVTSELPG